jgi:tetratricopeptide (TPR) repeat protein
MADVSNTEIIVALVGFFGAAVGALASLGGTYLSNSAAIKKEREQWNRRHEADLDAWQRDKLQEVYINCISSLSKIEQKEESVFKNPNETIDYSDLIMWLNILLIYQKNRNSSEYRNLYNRVLEIESKGFAGSAAGNLRADIIEMAAMDQRLQGSNEKQEKSAVYWLNKGKDRLGDGHRLGNKQIEEALHCFDKAIEIDPNFAESFESKGFALSKFGDEFSKNRQLDNAIDAYKKAIKSYDAALKIQPDKASIWSSKGYVLNRLGLYKESIAACDRAIAKDPNAFQAWGNKGYALCKSGQYKKAIELFDMAININNGDNKFLYYKAKALISDRQYQAAIDQLDKLLQKDSSLANAWVAKGDALECLGNIEQAVDAYKNALDADPHNNRANEKLKSALKLKEDG